MCVCDFNPTTKEAKQRPTTWPWKVAFIREAAQNKPEAKLDKNKWAFMLAEYVWAPK